MNDNFQGAYPGLNTLNTPMNAEFLLYHKSHNSLVQDPGYSSEMGDSEIGLLLSEVREASCAIIDLCLPEYIK